jgi:membrane protease YdiL (CAAX protease family)
MIIPEGIKSGDLKYHLIVIAIYILVCIYFFFIKDSPSSYFTFSKKDFLLLIPIALFSFVALYFTNKFLHFGVLGLNTETPWKIFLTLIYSVVFAVPEEIIFRGIIERSINSFSHNMWLAIVLSAVIFGAAHLLNGATNFWPPLGWDWPFMGMTFVAGLFLAFAYIRTGSLVTPILLHSAFIIVSQIFILKT